MKLFIKLYLLFLSLVISNALAVELKLKCKVDIKNISNDERIKKSTASVIVEISENSTSKRILLKGADESLIISTNNDHDRFFDHAIIDLSDNNKWDIFDGVFPKDKNINMTIENSIYIDRNSGSLMYKQIFSRDNRTTQNIGEGECEKIQVTNRKF
jgi:hypothetical protein